MELDKRKYNPLIKARENPRSRAMAIKAMCFDCVGQGRDPGWRTAVRECVISACPLWPLRPYQLREKSND